MRRLLAWGAVMISLTAFPTFAAARSLGEIACGGIHAECVKNCRWRTPSSQAHCIDQCDLDLVDCLQKFLIGHPAPTQQPAKGPKPVPPKGKQLPNGANGSGAAGIGNAGG